MGKKQQSQGSDSPRSDRPESGRPGYGKEQGFAGLGIDGPGSVVIPKYVYFQLEGHQRGFHSPV